MKRYIPFFVLLLLFSCLKQSEKKITPYKAQLIPEPVNFQTNSSQFTVSNSINLSIETENAQVLEFAHQFELFLSDMGIKVKKIRAANNTISIRLNDTNAAELGEEGYELSVNENAIELSAPQAPGIFNGLQTLKQLFPVGYNFSEGKTQFNIEGCTIKDYPRFAWRGLMLDVSRHFFNVDDVKAYIDQMAAYKFNTFHWHLTDDEGWRIEIKSLPKLTDVGAWRVERNGRFQEGRPFPKDGEEATYGGFYTHEQIKEVIQYAAERNITIVPEIDMPGHMMAALAAYPEFSTKKEPKFVNPGSKFADWYGDGSFKMLIENTLNPADEKVYDFIDKIFTEVAELFPGEYIHMGGDECYHGFWEQDPVVQKFMKKNKLKNTHQLQSYFVKRVDKIIQSKGKKTIGWDEILEGGLSEGAAVMSWRGTEGGVEAAKMGHNVVMSPKYFVYLDYTQGDYSVENKIYLDLSLEKTYLFEPVPEGVDPKFILGGQANLWTEVVPNLQFAYYMTYPRALAISETLWTPKEKKNWDSFINRTEAHFKRFDATNTNISKAVLDPIVRTYTEDGKMMCKLSNNASNTEIFYTIDNTYPAKYGIKYTVPFEVPKGNLSLHTQTFRNGKAIGRQLKINREDLTKRVERKELVLITED